MRETEVLVRRLEVMTTDVRQDRVVPPRTRPARGCVRVPLRVGGTQVRGFEAVVGWSVQRRGTRVCLSWC